MTRAKLIIFGSLAWLVIALALTVFSGVNEDDGPVVFLGILCGVPIALGTLSIFGVIGLVRTLFGMGGHGGYYHQEGHWW